MGDIRGFAWERRLEERGVGGGCGPTSMGGHENRVECIVEWVEKGERRK